MLVVVMGRRALCDKHEQTEEYVASSIERIIASRVENSARVVHPVLDSSPFAMPVA